jgi:hypothetical protein
MMGRQSTAPTPCAVPSGACARDIGKLLRNQRLLSNLRARCFQLQKRAAAQHISPFADGSAPFPGMYHVALFYGYHSIKDPAAVAEEQRQLCQRLELRGRLLLADEGFNGTLSGKEQSLRQYIDTVSTSQLFHGTDWKLSTGEKEPFPDLAVRVVKEIVNTGGLPVDINEGGVHLTPQEFHDQLAHATKDDLVLLDVRNTFEVCCLR